MDNYQKLKMPPKLTIVNRHRSLLDINLSKLLDHISTDWELDHSKIPDCFKSSRWEILSMVENILVWYTGNAKNLTRYIDTSYNDKWATIWKLLEWVIAWLKRE